MNVAGKRVLVTGAAGGLGQAVMRTLAASGARAVGIDRVDSGGDIVVADIRYADEARSAVEEAIVRLGGLDVLINNAGVLSLQDPGAPPDDATREAIEVHVLGNWNVTAAALPALLETRGRVVNVSSLFAVVNAPFIPAYAASKRALGAYSDVLRMHYRGRLSVTTVFPGYLNTPIHDGAVRQGLSVAKIVTFGVRGRTVISLEERLEKAARSLVRACSGRASRDRALTWHGAFSRVMARHAPGLVDWFVSWRIGRLARSGMSVTLEEPVSAAPFEHLTLTH